MITLPKDWVESMGMGKNDAVSLTVQQDGTLCINPGSVESKTHSEKTIDIDPEIDDEFLYRQLVGSYIAGHGTINIVCRDGIPGTKARIASSFTQTAIGLEIMDEDENRIIIKDLMNPSGILPCKSVERMRVLVRNMIGDVIGCMESCDRDVLETMSDRDKEVDRLDWLVFRQVNMHQMDPSLPRITGTDILETSHCAYISRTLERIGDHAVQMSENLRNIGDMSGFGFDIVNLGRKILSHFVKSSSTWSEHDVASANDCIMDGEKLVAEIMETTKGIHSDSEEEIIAMERVVGNMKRIVEYSIDIAEIAINGAMR